MLPPWSIPYWVEDLSLKVSGCTRVYEGWGWGREIWGSTVKLVVLDNVASVNYPILGGGSFSESKWLHQSLWGVGVREGGRLGAALLSWLYWTMLPLWSIPYWVEGLSLKVCGCSSVYEACGWGREIGGSTVKLVVLDNIASVIYPILGGGSFSESKWLH